MPIVRSKIDEETFKKIQKQGDYCNILFWTPTQFDLMQFDEDKSPKYKQVLFNSSYSTGKTEVIKGMMRKLMKNGKKVHFIFCVGRFAEKKPILLLQLENELVKEQFKDYIKFSWVKHEDLPSAVEKYPDHHVFVDEFILDMEEDSSSDNEDEDSKSSEATVNNIVSRGEVGISQMMQQLKFSEKVKLWIL